MKKISIIKKVLPIIFLLLLLFLIPLFKIKHIDEYFCNYNLKDVVVTAPYSCETSFLEKYRILSGDDNGVITASIGTPTECVNIIVSLLDKLEIFFTIRDQIPIESACEITVADEKIANLANLIKLKLLSIDSCEISYEEELILQAKFSSIISNNTNIVTFNYKDIITDIRYYSLRHAVKGDESTKNQAKLDRATTCLDYNRKNVIEDNITECSVKGDNTLGLSHYTMVLNTSTSEYTFDDLLK